MTRRPPVMELVISGNIDSLIQDNKPDNYYLEAVCRPEDGDLFFSENPLEIRLALDICFACPIKASCLDEAIANDLDGVWGGTTFEERQSYSKSRANLHSLTQEDAREELRSILTGGVQGLTIKYGVDERTIHRWRTTIQGRPEVLAFTVGR